MNAFLFRLRENLSNRKSGMELVQVAILIAIAVAIGLVFKDKISQFVNSTFKGLLNADF